MTTVSQGGQSGIPPLLPTLRYAAPFVNPIEHGNLSQANDAASEVDAILDRAERAGQRAVEQQRGQTVHAGPDQDLRLELSTITNDGPR